MDRLSDFDLSEDPFTTFLNWLEKAKNVETNAEALTLATTSTSGKPSARIVLFKGIENGEFPLYTNLESQKARELKANPQAALVFWWPNQGRQVRIEGRTRPMETERARTYFKSRSKSARIASLISQQSSPIEDRATLEKRFKERGEELKDRDVPFPETSWGGHWLSPESFEFFHYREHRLNDRFLYTRVPATKTWSIQRLQP